MSVWYEVENALEDIIPEYERVNQLISFKQDDRSRINGLKYIGGARGILLELGSGPGNFTCRLKNTVEGNLVGIDFSHKMLREGRRRVFDDETCYVRAIFERLPFRERVFNIAAAAYALRDSTDKNRSFREVSHSLRNQGRLLIVDIGKPNNPLIRGFFGLYLRFIVPIIAGLATSYGYNNPWRMLYRTYEKLPVNRVLERMLERAIGSAKVEELLLGGLVIAIAEKV